MFPAASISIL